MNIRLVGARRCAFALDELSRHDERSDASGAVKFNRCVADARFFIATQIDGRRRRGFPHG